MTVRQRHAAVLTKACNRLTGGRIDGIESAAAVEKDPEIVAVTPESDPAVVKAMPRLTLVGLRVKHPTLGAGLRIERYDTVVHGRDIQHVVDHDRRGLKRSRTSPELLHRHLAHVPFPRDLELVYVRRRDLIRQGVLGV